MALLKKLQTNNNFAVVADVPEVEAGIVGQVVMRKIGKIKMSPEQARTIFDQDALNELAQSIRNHGVLQPIVIRSDGTLVAGERRYRASKLAGVVEIPCIVRDVEDSKESYLLGLIENVQRENLNPMEEAVAYYVLSTEHGMTQEQIAGEVGKSRSVVANLIRLAQLPEAAQQAIRDNQITAAHGNEILRLASHAEAQQRIISDCVSNGWNVAELRQNVDFTLNKLNSRAVVNGSAVYTGTAEQQPQPMTVAEMVVAINHALKRYTTGTLEKRIEFVEAKDADFYREHVIKKSLTDEVFDQARKAVLDDLGTQLLARSQRAQAATAKSYVAPVNPETLPEWEQDEPLDLSFAEAQRQAPDNSVVVSGFSGGYSTTNAPAYQVEPEADQVEIMRSALRRIVYYGLSDERSAEIRELFKPVIEIAEQALKDAGIEV